MRQLGHWVVFECNRSEAQSAISYNDQGYPLCLQMKMGCYLDIHFDCLSPSEFLIQKSSSCVSAWLINLTVERTSWNNLCNNQKTMPSDTSLAQTCRKARQPKTKQWGSCLGTKCGVRSNSLNVTLDMEEKRNITKELPSVQRLRWSSG